MSNNKSQKSHSKYSLRNKSDASSVSESFRELLKSLSNEQLRDQELMTSIGFALRSFTNLHRFLELVPVVVSRLVGTECALLVPFQLDGRIWRDQLQAVPYEVCQELVRQISAFHPGTKKGFAEDYDQILAMDRLIQRHIISKGIFATSIVARGRERGRLYVFNLKSSFVWSDFYTQKSQLIADLVGVAIETEVLQKELIQHEKVDRQLSIGAEIQAQLLPDNCPVIEGVDLAARCRPAFQVGGDYYDFMPTRPELNVRKRETGRWALVIGDVMGKGVPAGLLMTMLRGMLRAEVLSGLPPDRILHDLNQLAHEDLSQSNRFVTLFYSDFDPRTRKLRFANAAHNPPLLWLQEDRKVIRLDAPGLLIGLQAEADYGVGSIILKPGDVLLYYTDGVTEAPGMTGDRFNEGRLVKALEDFCQNGSSAKQILDKIFNRLDCFVAKDHQLEDDASMVLLKVNEELVLPKLTQTLR